MAKQLSVGRRVEGSRGIQSWGSEVSSTLPISKLDGEICKVQRVVEDRSQEIGCVKDHVFMRADKINRNLSKSFT